MKSLYFIIFLVVILIPATLVFMISDNTPSVIVVEQGAQPANAVNAKRLLSKITHSLRKRQKFASVYAHEDELNSMLLLISKALPAVSGRVIVSESNAWLQLSVHVPQNLAGQYLNFSAELVPSTSGFVLTHVRIGNLPVNSWLARKLIIWGLDNFFEMELGRELVESIKAISFSNANIIVRYTPAADLNKKLKAFKQRFLNISATQGQKTPPFPVRQYFRELCLFDRSLKTAGTRSLSTYMTKMMSLLSQRVKQHGDRQQEARAAILAMGLYMGADQIERLVGRIRTGDLALCVPYKKIRLAGRKDLMLHFILSASMKTLSDNGLPYVVGESKELVDAAGRGSGFSFADLAADRAGIRFAEFFMHKVTAEQLQYLGQRKMTEILFFPSINGLPEGISKQQFEQHYKQVNSKPFKEMLKKIDRRIDQLPLYQ